MVKLCDEFPDGQTRLLSFGVINLTHHKSDSQPEQLRTGHWYDLSLKLDAIGYKMLQGHKITLHITTSYWPMIWTPRRATYMKIRKAHLSLPVLQDSTKYLDTSLIQGPVYGPALDIKELEPAQYDRKLIYGLSDDSK